MALPKATGAPRQAQPQTERGTTAHLAEYLQSPPNVFFRFLLNETCAIDGVVAGQVWGLNRIGQLVRISTTDEKRFQEFEHPEVVKQHRKLINQSLFSGIASNHVFHESSVHHAPGRLLSFWPLHLETESVGIVELIFSHELKPSDEKRIKELVTESSAYLVAQAHRKANAKPEVSEQHANPVRTSATNARNVSAQLDDATAGRVSALDVESFALLLHNQNDLPYVASTAVAETRRLIKCDRVSLVTGSKGVAEVAAISGQDDFSKKSNLVRVMRKLAKQVIDSGQEIGFELGNEYSPNPVSSTAFDRVVEFLDESGASWLKVIPLFVPEKIDFESNQHNSDQTPFAALIIELFSGSPQPTGQDIQRLTPHISQAVFHALRQENVLLLPMRRKLGSWAKRSKLTRSKFAALILLLALSIAALTFIQAPYRIEATGRLMPMAQFRAYAPFEGQVQKVLANSGQSVSKNQPLLSVYSESLVTRHLVLTNDLVEKQKLLSAYKAQLDETSSQLSQSEKISLNAKVVQLSLEIQGLDEQLKLTNRLLERSLARSPINGTVATFRPDDLLEGRPVSRGELLMEIMDERGSWQLELNVPEKRFGHLLSEMQANRSGLHVAFVQATNPIESFDATIMQVSTRVSVAEDNSGSVMVHASIDPGQRFRQTIGAKVIAQVHCGKRSLGYVLFGDIIDLAQRSIWSFK